MSIDLSIIIPAFNEAKRIPATLERIDDYVSTIGLHYEILVVDDGSSDDTESVVRAISAQRPTISCVAYGKNRGKGYAVRVGMLAARGAVRLMTDADCSIPPEEIPKLYAPIAEGRADIAIGSRYMLESNVSTPQPRWRVVWSRLCNRIIRRTLVGGIEDTQCGFKAWSARAAKSLFSVARIDGWAFDLEILALARQKKLRVLERGVVWQDDPRSRVSPLRDFIGVVREWRAIRSNLRSGVYQTPRLASCSATSIPRM